MTDTTHACPARSAEPLAYPFWTSEGLGLHPEYERLRDLPLTRVRLPYGEDAWLAIRLEDVRAVLSDPRFSLSEAVERDHPRIGPLPRTSNGLLGLDGPDHARLRALLAKEFTARRMEPKRERIHQIADTLLDRMEEKGPPADLIEDYALPLPMTLISELIGVPEADHPIVWKWVELVSSSHPDPAVIREHATEFFTQLHGWVEARRREPADDLLSALVRAQEEGAITGEELTALLNELLIGGFVTTTNQIGNFFSLLLLPGADGQDLLADLRADPGLIPKAVEEMLRYVPLLNGLTLPRYASEDVELGGVLVRAGEAIVVSQAAANRDPGIFPSPERLVLDRTRAAHISFGHGAHYCLGAHLARLELQIGLERVLTRMPALRLSVPEDQLRWRSKEFFTGLRALPVTW
ncbi:cytochrome P450 [Streptomyces tsukubensis]|uniref:Cytochrome n=1 Tax=Streptomyces tsukubensis TaxID=83656 RepID=A0A1V4A3B5_9ACTN|nr:cytochrome P450 [Streptomyces tsukubensis]OON73825.1 cytochrome [Streptomyces tsukubensis]QFR91804.1 cytochrome P450 [Streptomyces tsukubensis]